MARASVISPYTKFWDSVGLTPLSGGMVTFYLNMTTTPATIYSDPDLTVVQTNPYTLDDGGRIQGDVYFAGTLSLRLADSTGGDPYTIDDVTCFDPTSAFSDWNEFTTYGDGGANIVTASTGDYYVSIQAANTGNDPISSPLWWQQIEFFPGSATDIARLEAIGALTPSEQALIIGTGSTWTSILTAAAIPNYLAGLELSNNVSDADHDIDISAGRCANSTNTLILPLTAFTKRIDATWAAGTGNGGLASGASLSNNTWYHVFVVRVGSAVDAMFDSSVTCANGVANNAVTSFRRIGSVLTNGSANIIPFFQDGDVFTWDVMVQDVNTTDPTENAVTSTLSTPLGVVCLANLAAFLSSSSATQDGALLLTALAQTNTVPSSAVSNISIFSQAALNTFSAYAQVATNTSSQIRYRLTVTSTSTTLFTVTLHTIGWLDFRGR